MTWGDLLVWPGWALVQTLLTAAGLATVVIAAIELVRRRRGFPAVIFSLHPYGSIDIDGEPLTGTAGNRVQIFELANEGSGTGRVIGLALVGAEIHDSEHVHGWNMDGEAFRWRYGPGEAKRIALESADWERAWAILSWQTYGNVLEARVTWIPLVDSGPLSAEWSGQISAGRIARWRRRHDAVGPGHAPVRVIRVGRRMEAATQEAWKFAEDSGAQNYGRSREIKPEVAGGLDEVVP